MYAILILKRDNFEEIYRLVTVFEVNLDAGWLIFNVPRDTNLT